MIALYVIKGSSAAAYMQAKHTYLSFALTYFVTLELVKHTKF